MVKRVNLKIEGVIGEKDPLLAALGVEDNSTFSSRDMSAFLEANKDADEIECELRTPGGSVTMGFDIRNQLVNSGKRIIMNGYVVNSIGTVIFLAAKKEDRSISQYPEFVIHNASFDPSKIGTSLTADELQKITDDVRSAQDKIFNFYVQELGLDEAKNAELKALMDKETNLTTEQIIYFGFADGIIKGKSSQQAHSNNVLYTDLMVAVFNSSSKQNKTIMEIGDAIKNALKPLSDGLAKLESLIKGQTDIKNSTASLEDGTTIYFEGTFADGTSVFSDEAMTTPLADGDYVLQDGSTFSVSAGTVSNYTTTETMTAQLAQKDEEIQNLKSQLAAEKTKNTQVTTAVNELKNQFTTFQQNYIPGDKKITGGGNGNDGKSKAREDLERRREQRKGV